MKTSHTFRLLTATVAMGTLCSASPKDARAPWQPTWEEQTAPGLSYGVEVGSPALPGRTLDDGTGETCPKDTVACHLPRNWNCCPTAMPCCGPGCCAEGYRCVDARVGMCCPAGTALRGGVCARVREGDSCELKTTTTTTTTEDEECGGGMVCCEGQCSRRCGGLLEGDYCGPTTGECAGGLVCRQGRCSRRRCGRRVCGGATPVAGGWARGGGDGWWYAVVLLGTALANAV